MKYQYTKIKYFLITHQPSRFILKSIRNLFFPVPQKIDLAKTINIEISTICNAKCIYCNYRLGYRKKSFMSRKKFHYIAKECVAEGYENLDLTPMGGECFLNPEIIEIIRTAKSAGFKDVGAFTNGILLHKYNMEDLLTSGIDTLLISFPGFDPELYKMIYRVDGYSDFKKSVETLIVEHSKLNSQVQVIFEPRTFLTRDEILQSEFYQNFFKHFRNDRIFIVEPLRVFDSWCGDIRKTDLLPGMKLDRNAMKSFPLIGKAYLCNRLFVLGVNCNGNVRLCNCRYDATTDTESDSLLVDNIKYYKNLGDLLDNNRKKIEEIRFNFMKGNLPELCKKCTFYTPAKFR